MFHFPKHRGVTGPKFTKFKKLCNQIIIYERFKIRMAILRFISEFQNYIKENSQISPILTLNLVAMATSLKPSGKGGQFGNLRSNIYHGDNFVKIGLVDSEFTLLKSLF